MAGAQSVENKNPDNVGAQAMEIDLRMKKTIEKGLMTNARRALLVGLMDGQKENQEEGRKELDVLENA